MAKAIYVQKGKNIDYTNGGEAAIEYLDIVPMVSMIGVALEEIAVGETGAVATEEVFELPAESGTGLTFAVGDVVYYDTTNEYVTKTATDNIPAGVAVAAKAATVAVALIKIG